MKERGEEAKKSFCHELARLFFSWSGVAAGVGLIEVEHGVKNQEITAHGFAAPHGIVGEKNDMAFAVRNVHDGGLFGHLAAGGATGGWGQVLFRRGGQHAPP